MGEYWNPNEEPIPVGKGTKKAGCQPPPEEFVSALPVFSAHVEPLDWKWLERMAKSPANVGRTIFDSSFIINQGRYGSCNGCAGAMALTRARIRRGLSRVDLSGTDLYAQVNGNRDNGSMLDDGMQSITKRGVATLAKVPLTKIYRRQYDAKAADREARKYKAFECYRCVELADLWTALALGWDCVVVVHAGSSFSRLDSNGVSGVNRGRGNHAVAADGLLWAGGEIVADAYNSWGKSWGHRGRMLLTAEHFKQTIGVHSFYAIRSSTDSEDNPIPKPKR